MNASDDLIAGLIRKVAEQEIDISTLNAAIDGWHQTNREQRARINELVSALEYIRDLGADGADKKYMRAQAKAERALSKGEGV